MEIKIDTSGFDEMERRLGQMEAGVRHLHGQQVQLGDLLHPQFMRRYTQFGSLDEMLVESEWTVESVEDFEAIPDGPWDAYVQQTTRFHSWQEMQESAAQEWAKKKMGDALGL